MFLSLILIDDTCSHLSTVQLQIFRRIQVDHLQILFLPNLVQLLLYIIILVSGIAGSVNFFLFPILYSVVNFPHFGSLQEIFKACKTCMVVSTFPTFRAHWGQGTQQ